MKQFETKIKHFEAKIKHFEAIIKHFEAKMKHFEAGGSPKGAPKKGNEAKPTVLKQNRPF